jgi:glycopeptide antibiotics resistance protein
MRLEFFPFPFILGLVLLAALLIVRWRKKRNVWYLVCFGLFGAYLLLVVGATLFPLPPPNNTVDILSWRTVAFTLSHVNLIPFYYGTNVTSNFLFPEIVQNILMTLPFGFGVSFVARLKPRNLLWLGPVVGLAIELAQLMISFGVGGPYRSVDINDVLLNAIGVWIGYGLFRIFAWLVHRSDQGGKTGLVGFLQDVAAHSME